MGFKSLAIVLYLSHSFTLLAGENPAGLRDSIWIPPKERPPIRAILKDDVYRQKASEAVALFDKQLKEENGWPEFGAQLIQIFEGSRAQNQGLLNGDILIEIDGSPVKTRGDIVQNRKDAPQTLKFYRIGSGEFSIQVPEGKIGFDVRDYRKRTEESLKLPVGEKWKADLEIASKAWRDFPEVLETALSRILAAGCPMTAGFDLEAASLAQRQFRYDDAMAFSWFALQAEPKNFEAAYIFYNSAISSCRYQAAVEVLKGHPDLNLDPVQLNSFIERHNKRTSIELPLDAASRFFHDPLPLVGETAGGLGNGLLESAVFSCPFTLSAVTGWYEAASIKPADRVILDFKFTFKETDIAVSRFLKHFSLGMFDIAEDEKSNPNVRFRVSQNGNTHGLTGVSFDRPYLRILGGKSGIIASHPIPEFFNDPKKIHHFQLAVLNDHMEIRLDGKRVFYGPIDERVSPTGLAFKVVGCTVKMTDFKCANLLTEDEYRQTVSKGIDKKYRFQTRLNYAIESYSAKEVEYLLELGASLRNRPESPLQVALRRQKRDIALMLIDKGANVDLHSAIALPHKSLINDQLKVLPKAFKMDNPWSALHGAVMSRDLEVVKLMLDNNVNINSVAGVGKTPLMLAVEYNDKAIVELLVSRGAKVNIGDPEGITPLAIAVEQNDEIAELLKKNGAVLEAAPFEPRPETRKPMLPPQPPQDVPPGDF